MEILKYFIGFLAILGFIMIPKFRCMVLHPIGTIWNAIIDIFKYFWFKKWREAKYGKIVGFIADDSKAFGCGKTLTSVNFLNNLYDKYNGKKIWCPERKKWVTQRITILSNVAFKNIPYIKLTSFQQMVSYLKERYIKDKEEDVITVTYTLIDEASSILNSRNFKNNFSATTIATLLTSRHYRSMLYYTSQRYTLVDALLRNVTSYCISCNKTWRLQGINYYDAYELENSPNPAAVKPYRRSCWFIKNKNYNKYNTYELLQDVEKKCEEGDMMTEQEILASLQMPTANIDGVMKPSRKYNKSRKKMTK